MYIIAINAINAISNHTTHTALSSPFSWAFVQTLQKLDDPLNIKVGHHPITVSFTFSASAHLKAFLELKTKTKSMV
jgi:hypothetical protein